MLQLLFKTTWGHWCSDGMYWHHVLILLRILGHTNKTLYSLAAGIGGQIQSTKFVVLSIRGTHYEPDTVNLHQFSIITRLIHMWMYVYRKHIPRHMDQMNNKECNNPTMMMFEMCDIWSLLHSDSGTPISDLSEFYRSINPSMDCQWWVTLVGRWLKCRTVLIIIIIMHYIIPLSWHNLIIW